MKKSFTYSDMDSGLQIESSGNITIKYDEDVIIQSLESLFATMFGEEIRSNIGSRLIMLLGRPVNGDTALSIRQEIRNTIENYEPRVGIDRINVFPDPDKGQYQVNVIVKAQKISPRINFNRRIRALG